MPKNTVIGGHCSDCGERLTVIYRITEANAAWAAEHGARCPDCSAKRRAYISLKKKNAKARRGEASSGREAHAT